MPRYGRKVAIPRDRSLLSGFAFRLVVPTAPSRTHPEDSGAS